MNWLEPFLGFVTGTLIGLTGIGGGLLMTPALLFLGVAPAVAVGTDLVFGGVTKVVAAWRHGRAGQVAWSWVRRTALPAIPAAWAGSYLAWRLHLVGGEAEVWLRHLLGAVLVLASAGLVAADLWRARARVSAENGEPVRDEVPPRWLWPAGTAIGFLVGLTSVGSGSLYMLLLLFTGALRPARMVGTDLAFGAVVVAAAALAHGLGGTVDFALAARLLGGAIPGVLLGTRLAGVAPPRLLRTGLATCVLLSGLRLVAA